MIRPTDSITFLLSFISSLFFCSIDYYLLSSYVLLWGLRTMLVHVILLLCFDCRHYCRIFAVYTAQDWPCTYPRQIHTRGHIQRVLLYAFDILWFLWTNNVGIDQEDQAQRICPDPSSAPDVRFLTERHFGLENRLQGGRSVGQDGGHDWVVRCDWGMKICVGNE